MTCQMSPRPDVGRGGFVLGYTGYTEREVLKGVKISSERSTGWAERIPHLINGANRAFEALEKPGFTSKFRIAPVPPRFVIA